jgi:hypothetical protein
MQSITRAMQHAGSGGVARPDSLVSAVKVSSMRGFFDESASMASALMSNSSRFRNARACTVVPSAQSCSPRCGPSSRTSLSSAG